MGNTFLKILCGEGEREAKKVIEAQALIWFRRVMCPLIPKNPEDTVIYKFNSFLPWDNDLREANEDVPDVVVYDFRYPHVLVAKEWLKKYMGKDYYALYNEVGVGRLEIIRTRRRYHVFISSPKEDCRKTNTMFSVYNFEERDWAGEFFPKILKDKSLWSHVKIFESVSSDVKLMTLWALTDRKHPLLLELKEGEYLLFSDERVYL